MPQGRPARPHPPKSRAQQFRAVKLRHAILVLHPPPLPEPVSRARLRAPNGRKPCPLRTPLTVPRSKPFCWPGACQKKTRSRRRKSSPGPICTAWTATASRCCRATTNGGARARQDGCAAEDRARNSGFRAGRWRWRTGPCAGRFAMNLAIEKAKKSGLAASAVRNSAHFGATGYLHADGGRGGPDRHGLHLRRRHPGGTHLRQAGAARHRSVVVCRPSADGKPFLLDMATTTVAADAAQQAERGTALPAGWVLTKDGPPSIDRCRSTRERRLHDLARRLAGKQQLQRIRAGGDGEHPGILPVGCDADHRSDHTKKPQGKDIGHFFMAIDPAMFRDPGNSRPTWRGSAATCGRPRRSIRRSR